MLAEAIQVKVNKMLDDDFKDAQSCIEVLNDNDVYFVRRAQAAIILGDHGGEGAFEALIGALDIEKDDDIRELIDDGFWYDSEGKWDAIRHGATKGLGKLGDKQAVEPLKDVLISHLSSDRVRYAAAESIRKIGCEGACEALIEALDIHSRSSISYNEEKLRMQRIVAYNLVKLVDKRTFESLIGLLGKKHSWSTRIWATLILGELAVNQQTIVDLREKGSIDAVIKVLNGIKIENLFYHNQILLSSLRPFLFQSIEWDGCWVGHSDYSIGDDDIRELFDEYVEAGWDENNYEEYKKALLDSVEQDLYCIDTSTNYTKHNCIDMGEALELQLSSVLEKLQ